MLKITFCPTHRGQSLFQVVICKTGMFTNSKKLSVAFLAGNIITVIYKPDSHAVSSASDVPTPQLPVV